MFNFVHVLLVPYLFIYGPHLTMHQTVGLMGY